MITSLIVSSLHQDVKLKNILVFLEEPASTPTDSHPSEPPKYSFKLADLGISHFVRSTHGSQDVFAEDKMGTETYGRCSSPKARTAVDKTQGLPKPFEKLKAISVRVS